MNERTYILLSKDEEEQLIIQTLKQLARKKRVMLQIYDAAEELTEIIDSHEEIKERVRDCAEMKKLETSRILSDHVTEERFVLSSQEKILHEFSQKDLS